MNDELDTEIENAKTAYKAWRQVNKSQKAELYELLAKNLGIIENILTVYDHANIDDRLERIKIKVNADSPIELKIIRLIMTSERKKASGYAIVLKAARKAGIKSADFVKWLKAQGGIEAVRQANSTSKKPADIKQQYEAGKRIALSKASLATVTLDIPHAQKNDLVLLVARVGDNKQVEIVEIAGTGESSDLVTKSVSAISASANGKLQGSAVPSNPGHTALASLVKSTAASFAKEDKMNA